MGTLINLFVRFSGLGKLWGWTDGKKTYISAAIAILSGLAGLLGNLLPLVAAHNAAGILAFVKTLPSDQAWLMLVGGLASLGIGHKLDKAASEPSTTNS